MMLLGLAGREKVSLFSFSKKTRENGEYVKLLVVNYFFL